MIAAADPVHEAVFFDLLSQVGGDRRVLRRLVEDFVAQWDERMRRLDRAVSYEDWADAGVVLRSIRSTAVMLGAADLGDESKRMFHVVTGGTPVPLEGIRSIGDRTCVRLQELAA